MDSSWGYSEADYWRKTSPPDFPDEVVQPAVDLVIQATGLAPTLVDYAVRLTLQKVGPAIAERASKRSSEAKS